MRKRSMSFLVLVSLVGVFASVPQAVATESNSATIGGNGGPQQPEKGRTFYVVSADPTDDTIAWSYLEQLSKDTYMVFINITRGEGTESCLPPEDAYNRPGSDALAPTAHDTPHLETFVRRVLGQKAETDEDSTGPYKYEGPNSPVGEPDKNERHPLGYPWVGQGTEACKDAIGASFHWFHDEQFHNDGIGTDLEIENDPELDDDYKGEFCPPGHQGKGEGRPIEKQIGCAEVWADELGGRIFFDLGNAPYEDGFAAPLYTSEDVTAALQSVRTHRAEWGLPLLPEEGVLATSRFSDGESCEPQPSFGPERAVVNEAIRYHDQGLPLRAGAMACAEDKLGEGATVRQLVQATSSLVLWNMMNPVTGERLGAAIRNWGWIVPDYEFAGCDVCNYWEVREEVTGG